MGLFDLFKKKTDSLGNPIDNDIVGNGNEDADLIKYAGSIDPGASSFRMTIEDVFTITGRGAVATGRIEVGTINIGDKVLIARINGQVLTSTITGIEMFRKLLNTVTVGDNVGLLLRGIDRDMISTGDIILMP